MYVERAGGLCESADVRRASRTVPSSSARARRRTGRATRRLFAQIAADELGVDPGDVPRASGATPTRSPGRRHVRQPLGRMGGSASLSLRGSWSRARRSAACRWSSWLQRRAASRPRGASARAASSPRAPTSPWSRSTGRRGVSACSRLRPSTTRGGSSTRCSPRARCSAATVQGLGAVPVEEAVHDEDGQLRTSSFADYSLLTAAELPPIESRFVETPSPLNPLGAKGIGEGGAIGDAGGRRERRRGRARPVRRAPRRPAVHRREALAVAAVKPRRFAYDDPRTLDEALALLAARGGREGAGGRAEPRPAAELPPRAPGAARRRQPGRGACVPAARRRRPPHRRAGPAGRPGALAGSRAGWPLLAAAVRYVGHPRSAAAGRSAARSPTPTRPRSCRSR